MRRVHAFTQSIVVVQSLVPFVTFIQSLIHASLTQCSPCAALALLMAARATADVDEADRVLADARALSPVGALPLSLRTAYVYVLAAAARASTADAESTIARAEAMAAEAPTTSVHLLNATLAVYTHALRLRRAQRFFDTRFSDAGIRRNEASYTLMLAMFAKGSLEDDDVSCVWLWFCASLVDVC